MRLLIVVGCCRSARAFCSAPAPPIPALRVLSWRVDGSRKRFVPERTAAVLSEIGHHSPDVVFLQDVAEESVDAVKDWCRQQQYVAMFSASTCSAVKLPQFGDVQQVSLKDNSVPNSTLLHLNAEFTHPSDAELKVKVALVNNSFEPYRDGSVRMRQFHASAEHVENNCTAEQLVIYGGGLNLRASELSPRGADRELADMLEGDLGFNGQPPAAVLEQKLHLQDCWVYAKRPHTAVFSWDTSVNPNTYLGLRPQFDQSSGRPLSSDDMPKGRLCRLYFRQPRDWASMDASGSFVYRMRPSGFYLAGNVRMRDLQRFPSGYFAIMTDIGLRHRAAAGRGDTSLADRLEEAAG